MANKKELRIIITVDPEIPVPPECYGGIERVVDLLAKGLSRRGHKISLFAHPGSKTAAKIISYKGRKSSFWLDTVKNAVQIRKYFKNDRADLIHSFGRLAYLFLLAKTPVLKIQSYQRYITPRSIHLGNLLMGKYFRVTTCSRFCARPFKKFKEQFSVIPNGVEIKKYRFTSYVSLDAPLVFLGRVEKIKGVHVPIEAAKKSGKRLIIAGNHLRSGEGYRYFKEDILPHCDGKKIIYTGPLNDIQKNELLGRALALLFPIQWDEPFGIVMAEALACGTPVIALNKGAVSEVIQNKKTGFVSNSTEEIIEAIRNIKSIKRDDCRKQAVKYFSDEILVDRYERLYYSCLGGIKGVG